jgi:hypothetical protein
MGSKNKIAKHILPIMSNYRTVVIILNNHLRAIKNYRLLHALITSLHPEKIL